MAESALKKALVALASAVAQGVIHDDPAATGPALVTAMLAGDPVSQHCAAELGTADTVTTVFYAKRACVVKTAGIIVTTTLAFNAAEYRTMELKVCDGAGVVGAAIATLTTVTVALTAATKRAFTLPTGGQALGIRGEAGGEAKAFLQLEKPDGVGGFGGVAARGDADDGPGEEATPAGEGNGASTLAPAERAGMAALDREPPALDAAPTLEHHSAPRIVTVETTPLPPRLCASPIRASRTWLAASPRSCFTSS